MTCKWPYCAGVNGTACCSCAEKNSRTTESTLSALTAEAGKGLTVDALAQEIRRVDGNHSLGAGALAEALLPFIALSTATPAGEWVAEITGVDEYGPMLTWRKHWVDCGIGTKLYAGAKP